MDALDLRIAAILGADGRKSNREIAKQLEISEGAVRQRLGRMVRAGNLRIAAQLNLEALEGMFLALVAIKLDGRQLQERASEIDRLPGVQNTMIVTGQYDLLVTVLLDSHNALVDFVTEHLSHVPGVRESETFVVLKNYRHWMTVADGEKI